MEKKVTPINLKKMALAIAKSYGDKGAILITVGDEGVRIGAEGLSHQDVQDALCLAIHYNFCVDEGVVD